MKYHVTANHRCEQFRCNEIAEIHYDKYQGTYSAFMASYGCSKEALSPEQAIESMLWSHACFDIVMTRESES
jgi:hypothetical protein